MQETPSRTIFGEITDFLATNPTPQQIVDYQLPDDLQQRAHDLLERNGEAELSSLEHDEMMDYVRINDMLSLFKIKMRIKLKQSEE